MNIIGSDYAFGAWFRTEIAHRTRLLQAARLEAA